MVVVEKKKMQSGDGLSNGLAINMWFQAQRP